MIELELSPQQRMLRDMAHTLAANEIRPIALEADRTGEVPIEFLRRLRAMGLTNGDVPKQYGGEDGGVGDDPTPKGDAQKNRVQAIGSEELAWGDPGVL